VLGSLFAGQLNSGINAAYLLCFLGRDPHWKGKVIEEIHTVADKYSPDKTKPLVDRLMDVPLEAWEGEFPIVDICLKDSIRLNLPGTAFRQNLSGQDIPLDKEGRIVVPNGAFMTYASGDMFYNPDIYPNPEQWDPARYLPERAEDKKEQYAWTGWGVARHPCLGMRFAKLEMSMIVSFFVAYFPDFHVCDFEGVKSDFIPLGDRNNLTAKKPREKVYLKYQ
jgi:sterol 14-demethylase